MFWQMFLAFGLLIVLALGSLGGAVGAWVEQQALAQVEDRLKTKAILLQELVRLRKSDELQSQIEVLQTQTQARITLIGKDGIVLAESDRDDLPKLDNHGQRPEVEAARIAKSKFGVATRYSTTLRKKMMYVALQTTGTGDVAFVRVAMPVTVVQEQADHLRNLVWGTAAAAALIALFITWRLTRRFATPLQELTTGAQKIAGGDYGHKVYVERRDEFGQLGSTFNYMSGQLAAQFAQLDEDRQQLRAVLSGMVEGVIAIDAEQNILFANDCAGQMWDFGSRSAAGRKLWEVVRQRDVLELVQTTMSEADAEAHKLEFNAPAGKSLLVHIAQLPGKPTRGAVLVFHDTTELRHLERLRQDFVANVSHELKTPLSVITACVETLIFGGVDDLENRGRFLDRIHEQTQRLHALILDLLSLARIESGEQAWTMQTFVVADVIRACVERHQERLQAKQQTLALEPPDHDAEIVVFADIEAVSEILDNLVDNAVKYTPQGGTLRLRWSADADQCIIEVEDTGIGIPHGDLPRIFERFYRVDKARSREMGGTGLGLSIVKHLAQAMRGSVGAASELGKGSVFTVRLPRTKGAAQANRAEKKPHPLEIAAP
jgi:two-component system phosphate regulon sensor histidine kinase PhoR